MHTHCFTPITSIYLLWMFCQCIGALKLGTGLGLAGTVSWHMQPVSVQRGRAEM